MLLIRSPRATSLAQKTMSRFGHMSPAPSWIQYSLWQTYAVSMKETSGHCPRTLSTGICFENFWSIKLCMCWDPISFHLRKSHLFNSHPSNSLIYFLVVSNSLDLIISITMEVGSTIAGTVPPLFGIVSQILSQMCRFRDSLQPEGDLGCFRRSISKTEI